MDVQLFSATTLRGDAKAAGGRTQEDPFVAGLASRLPPELRKKRVEIEPRVLRWTNARRENALKFTMDPLGSTCSGGGSPRFVGEAVARAAIRARVRLRGRKLVSSWCSSR